MKNLNNINDWTDVTEHQRLGEILLASGKINLIQLGMALDVQKFQKMQLGQVLIDMKIIDNKILYSALELQNEIDEFLELKQDRME